ncbi:NAD-dependent epimerase/dehydratase family protein [Limnothrix sp. FACHB-708]|uniref:NAD-dependent epimerase/dehydratase family protein n=1 Tax=unclassified Limnothrix TaxID=2632864 RepID=UPI001684D112|nr:MULTISPECIES: NAD-dependent epimerase/dehydratase family protein [unclassified Limnothrix]MBD2552236.1 NAD-dependent epimerase/dehydratase family protein [Limnothrix sp. FACHB-708]MBD2592104.1 NAD-dependent epimerase/dehydratase family protein [Limnothrix sp. FACHB-406]
MKINPLAEDLDYILETTHDLWEDLRSQRIFITGGTGFFGRWLLESLVWANDKQALEVKALVLTRNPAAFAKKAPHLVSHPAIEFHVGDVRSFSFPDGAFSHIIHAATEASAQLNQEAPLLMLDTIVQGTRHVLEFARHCGAKKFLLTSSGAVYGQQPPDMTHIPEDYRGAPDTMDAKSAYGEGKRMAELLCTIYAQQCNIETKIARCFAFVGPHLPLESHFAIGNFIRDALQGASILVNGDGKPYRSYLYVADLVIWLWTILLKGQSCYPYNVGSEESLSIANVAHVVREIFHQNIQVEICQCPASNAATSRYVPSSKRALSELNLQPRVDLVNAVRRTIAWLLMDSQVNHLCEIKRKS